MKRVLLALLGLLFLLAAAAPAGAQVVSYTTCYGLIKPAPLNAANTNNWGGLLNTNEDLTDTMVGQTLALSLAASSGATLVLTSTSGSPDQSRNPNYILTGTLTGNVTVLWPASLCHIFSVTNLTTGGFAVTLGVNNGSGSPAGTTAVLPVGATVSFVDDGTNISRRYNAEADSSTVSVAGSANVVLTAAQASAPRLILTGTITANIVALLPQGVVSVVVVTNATSGAFTLSMGMNNGAGSAAGTVFNIPQGVTAALASDGTNVNLIFASVGAYYTGGTTAGTANAQTVSTLAGNFTLTAGNVVSFIAGIANTSGITLAVDGTAATSVRHRQSGGTAANMGLVTGDLIVGQAYLAEFDGTFFELLGEALPTGALASIASAGTTTLAQALQSVQITGTTTITSFGTGAGIGTIKTLEFAGALTLTNSANLILPGGINIPTNAGDTAIARYEGSGVWRVISYSRANGTAVIASPSGGFVNRLRDASLTSWFSGISGTITTAGGWTAEGVYVVPTGASVTWSRNGTTVSNYGPYTLGNRFQLGITGGAGNTDVTLRFVVSAPDAALLTSQIETFQVVWSNGSGATLAPKITVKTAVSPDVWTSPNTVVSAQPTQSLANLGAGVAAYAWTDTGSAYNGVSVDIDFGALGSGQSINIFGFDLRVTPSATAGIVASPPFPEIRDAETDESWNAEFYQASYDNNVAPGTATHVGMTGAINGSSIAAVFAGNLVFPVKMRCDPTLSLWDGAGNANKFSVYAGNAWTDNYSGFTSSVITAGHGGAVIGSSGAYSAPLMTHYAADCRITGA